MSSKFKLDSRGKRSDSLESLDSGTHQENGSTEHGWRKAKRNAGTRPGTRSRANRRDNSKVNSTVEDAVRVDPGHSANVENPPLSSEDESDLVYETDLQELSEVQSVESAGLDAELFTPDSEKSSRARGKCGSYFDRSVVN